MTEDNAHLVLLDETGLFMNPTVRRTWALLGQTPVLPGDGGRRDKVSAIGAVTVSPIDHHLNFYMVDPIYKTKKPRSRTPFLPL